MPRSSPLVPALATLATLASLALTPIAMAGPGPGAGSATPTDAVKASGPTAVAAGTPTPRFDRKLVDDVLARRLVRRAGDAYLGFARCDAARPGLYLPRCIVLLVGDAKRQTAYELTDTKCPAAAPRAACYAGFVIGVRADAELAYDPATGTTTSVTGLRVGTRTKAARGSTYALTGKVATVTHVVRLQGASSHVELKVQAGGVTVIDTGWDRMAAGSLTCGDQGELVSNTVATIGSLAAVAIGGYIGLGSMIGGATLAVVGAGATLGAGTAPAVAAGAALSASGIAFGAAMALALRELGVWTGRLTGTMHREACEMLEKIDHLDPEAIEQIGKDAASEMGSGGSGGGSGGSGALCTGTFSGTTTCEDGSETPLECEAGWSGGECQMTCVSICGGVE